ncbi:hypothetical protein GMRT_10569 [Giardia muris]|uniref:Uncharacterized protein n=1 Tax=Giardia muris TaxID=5742 RepID=A0A4Z1SMD5_GIAMU|nr:hypothetical protein GMRT_10569 [Giardia muris]|eukprot:TNJ26852.1 hypothetical protein GMRT_10569 [Giardia muris]
MSIPGVTQNIYSCRTMINNWYEERAQREEVLRRYLEREASGDLKAHRVIAQMENILKPAALADARVLFEGDGVLLVNHNARALMLACDPRYPLKEYPDGCRVSLCEGVAPLRRSVFHARRVAQALTDQNLVKYGKRLAYMFTAQELASHETKLSTLSATNAIGEDVPIRYGERINILCDVDMIADSDKFGKIGGAGDEVGLGCVRVPGSSTIHVVIGPLGCLHKDAEFVIEPFHASLRLELEGHPVLLDQPVVVRHCATGHCIGSGEAPKPAPTDLDAPEFLCQCRSVLNQHRRETEPNLFTLTCGRD